MLWKVKAPTPSFVGCPPQMATRASIVIPTKNAGDGFRETLEAIQAQDPAPAELIVVDSGSVDGTPRLADSYGAKVLTIPPESFNHGETRNLGLAAARGEIGVLLVQDAVPEGTNWLAEMIRPFENERVAGVSGAQTPRADADLVALWEVAYSRRVLGDEFRLQQVENWCSFLTASLPERLQMAAFNNVCSAVRRSCWEAQPFRQLPFAEDLDWGVRALEKGLCIAYNPAARVIHSHNRSASYDLRRHYLAWKTVPELLGAQDFESDIQGDREFRILAAALCGEVESILEERAADWRRLWEREECCELPPNFLRSWGGIFGLCAPPHSSTDNPMRRHFYSLLRELEAFDNSDTTGLTGRVLVRAMAQSIGHFAATYYKWCRANQRVSRSMALLDRALSARV
ncbi:MAG: glycosyltransferase family 2 protein [Acidobacteria bacterium]|nr:glycosyltransferase family 2 protein [Acidobacteriota bacterium]